MYFTSLKYSEKLSGAISGNALVCRKIMCVCVNASLFMTQPPPSYDQVIQEKTQEEHIVKPTAAPRRTTCTTTSATQTDPVREDTSTTTVPECSAAPQSAEQKSAGEAHENNCLWCEWCQFDVSVYLQFYMWRLLTFVSS